MQSLVELNSIPQEAMGRMQVKRHESFPIKFMNTEIWISCNFDVSQNSLLIFFFFLTTKNLKTIADLPVIHEWGQGLSLALVLFA